MMPVDKLFQFMQSAFQGRRSSKSWRKGLSEIQFSTAPVNKLNQQDWDSGVARCRTKALLIEYLERERNLVYRLSKAAKNISMG